MADEKISDLTAKGSIAGTDLFEIEEAGGASKKVTASLITVPVGSVTGLGTGISTALAINTGTAGAPVINGGPLGTPSGGDVSNCTGSGAAVVSDTAYNASTWDGDATHAPSKNAVRDKIESLSLGGGNVSNSGSPTIGQLASWVSSTSIQGITTGTGVETALGVNVGGAGAFVVLNGAGGTPSVISLVNGINLPISGLTASTSTALGVGSIELGHATDTTIARTSSGVVAIEGDNIVTAASVITLSNKAIPSGTNTISTYVSSYAANHTLTSAECYGGFITVTAAATMTLPAAIAGMQVTVATVGATAVSVDPNASEILTLDGTALTGGHKASNLSTAGDIISLVSTSSGHWYAASNAWTDGG